MNKNIELAILLVAAFACIYGMYLVEQRNMEEEAIKHHAGRYIVDKATGDLTFKWNDELQPTDIKNYY